MLRLPKSFWTALAEGTAYAVLGLVAVLSAAYVHGGLTEDRWQPDVHHGFFSADFARRWDGGCSGWTRGEAERHLWGNVFHWWAYCTIAFVFWRLHPPLSTVPYSTITLTLVGAFIIGCGITHLAAILTMFWPAYRIEGAWLWINGVVSMVSTVFVAFSLTRAFEVVHAHRQDVERMKEELRVLRAAGGH